MTTATVTQPEPTASDTAPSPDVIDLGSVFYGSEKAPVTDLPEETGKPTPVEDAGHSTTAEKPTVDSPETAKEPPKGTAEDSGHRAAAARLGKEVKELKAQLEALTEEARIAKEKEAGTYKEPVKPTPEEIERRAEFSGREKASRSVAEGLFGADEVQAKVYDKGSAYEVLIGKKPWVQLQVMRSAQPAVEAMRLLEHETFVEKYGDDSSKWVEKIRAEIEPAIIEKFKQETTKTPTGKEPATVTAARGSGGPERERSIADLFYGAESRKG